MQEIKELEQRIGYSFKDNRLLIEALTHPSASLKSPEDRHFNNQRLEFLGDSILTLILAEELFKKFPHRREGFLTKAQSFLAQSSTLVEIARCFDLGLYVYVGEADRNRDCHWRPSTLEDTLEGIIGAIYLDSDFKVVTRVVLGWYAPFFERLSEFLDYNNPKGKIQEILQKRDGENLLTYATVEESGPSHEKIFVVHLSYRAEVIATGIGRSKKTAEIQAAEIALRTFFVDAEHTL